MKRLRGHCRWIFGCFLLIQLPVTASAGEKTATFRALRQDSDSWEISYESRVRSLIPVIVEGKSFYRFADPSCGNSETGSPSLPADVIVLGIPFGVTLSAEILQPQYEEIGNTPISPVPSYDLTEELDAVEVFKKDRRVYNGTDFLPLHPVEVEKPFVLRSQNVGVIRIYPYQYNPAVNRLRRLVRATLKISIIGKTSVTDAVASVDPHFEDTYRTLLWNYAQARQWRAKPMFERVPNSDATRDWFATNTNYYKTLISADAWHKITRNDLLAAGANLQSIDLSSIKLFERGVQVPIVVRPDTTVEFYGHRNAGDSTYTDFFTDTSAFWLTWGGSPGLRFASSSSTGATQTIVSSSVTAHVEQDLAYFSGQSSDEIININTVPGEGWYWSSLNLDNTRDLSFALDSIDRSVASSVIRLRLWGMSVASGPPPPVAHKARVWLNDSLVGDIDFAQRSGALLVANVASAWLKVGTNTLRVKNINTGIGANSFYVDWFELTYQRMLRSRNDQLVFTSPGTSGGGAVEFRVGGFSNSQIEVYDLTLHRSVEGRIVSGDSVAGFTVTFADTFSSPRTYVAFCSGSQRPVPPLKQKMFSDIRINPQGADYIIITNKSFAAQANQLAAFRQSVNGVRVKVIDVDDIYDEFNYGIFNATIMKAFLQYAYENWSTPAPAYVLFVGDASWDYHRNLTTTVKVNFVPSYGYPWSDNWFACFNPALPYIPSMYIGRIPAEDVQQAQNVVNKIIGYENYPLAEWNKNFLFITGGNTLSEQAGFNYLAESCIDTYIEPAPLGGTPYRVYKATPGWIDGEHKTTLKNYFRNGLGFVSFTGHSGGRIWGVDPGPPSELENTNGMLPFVSSVSCNVGGFASPANSVLAEQFVVAENRGAIASWASSSLGYATYGAALTNYWLKNACFDSVREFGKLTTNARYQLWFETGAGYITVAMVNLNPLIGDPISRFAVPLKPEIAVSPSDISLSRSTPTVRDSSLTIRLGIHNYGLVPADSLDVSLTDIYNGQATSVLNNARVRRPYHKDSLLVTWGRTSEFGPHTFVANLDPNNAIDEVNELNNIASSDNVVYTNNLYVVRPLNNVVVASGPQRLVVTSPIGYDSAGFSYYFELDTVATFDSPFRISSGAVLPGPASGEWTTPSVSDGKTYFWRAHTKHGSFDGNWVISSFSVSNNLPTSSNAVGPLVRWRQSAKKQFQRNTLANTAATDSGVTIQPRESLHLYARSVGYRYNQYIDYYSQLEMNTQKVIGFWWELGSSFMVSRVNDFNGTFEFKNFNVSSNTALSDSMKAFIDATPQGSYISVAVIFDGRTGVTENLNKAMDTLGATLFRSIVPGQSYAFIGRKGSGAPGMVPLEQLSNDTAVVTLTVPNFYSWGSGSMASEPVPIAQTWSSFHWRRTGDFFKVSARVALLGVKTTGGVDTLRLLPKDSIDIDIASLNPLTSGPRFMALQPVSLLSTLDANVTPSITDWWMDFSPPPDIAVSARTVGMNLADARGFYSLPVTVYNIGYATSDSVRVVVNALDKYNRSQQLAIGLLDSIAIDGSKSTNISFSTDGLPRRIKLQVTAFPMRKGRDLNVENNTAYYILYLPAIPVRNDVQVFVNGAQILDGDYISSRPTILVRRKNRVESTVSKLSMYVDNVAAESKTANTLMKAGDSPASIEQLFSPILSNGQHQLSFRIVGVNSLGELDSLEQSLTVNVLNESRVLKVTNFPNPFRTDTWITFVLTGAEVPEEVTIKVFTVAGRRVRTIGLGPASLRLGFNKVQWDGRDDDGDEIANGYYFYQISLKNNESSRSDVQKMAKIR